MPGFTAWSSFPAAPLASSLIKNALNENFPDLQLSESDDHPQEQSPAGPFLQWSTYDSLSHELTLRYPKTVLSSSYTIRKSLIRKHFLNQCITSYTTKHPDAFLSRHGSLPQTWSIDISFADELDEMWSDELYELRQLLDENEEAPSEERKWFILKPSMSDRGQGIRLFDSVEALVEIFESFEEDEEDEDNEEQEHLAEKPGVDTNVIASQLRHFVIQASEYLSAPLLLDPSRFVGSATPSSSPAAGRKASIHSEFHIRAYCIASGALEVFVNPHFLALFAGASYKPPKRDVDEDGSSTELDLTAHLTNTSLQTPTSDNPDPNDNVRLLSEMVGSPILSSTVEESNTLTQEDVDLITRLVYETLADTFRAALESSVHFQTLPNAFELFGADLLVSHTPPSTQKDLPKFTISLLELNAEPAIELTGARLQWILESMFSGVCKACVAPFFSVPTKDVDDNTGEWKVGATRHGLYKCLSVSVRGAEGWSR
ncbi:hypothetical protein DL93DRAFT_2062864 [Clavulina sp. PMI_390]|nr:hypothetical protein DL93DRAFT_2062864 [Clavulina sp. PMI_390]